MTLDPDVTSGHSGGNAETTAEPVPHPRPHPARAKQQSLRSRVAVWVLSIGLAAISLGAAFAAGIAYERNVLAAGSAASDEPLAVFDVAWQTVLDNYVDEEAISEPAMLEAAIEGMLATLGDEGHTRYQTAEETARDREQTRGVYQGVGVQVRDDIEDGLVVTRVFPDSPAREEGVQPGDVIVAVDGVDVTELQLDEIIGMIRGPEGSRVDLTVLRPSLGEEITFDLERREIEISAVSWEMLDDDVALLRLSEFSERAGEDLENALKQAQEDGASGVILDLRGNPGGLVREAMEVASLFVPDEAPVYITQSRDGGEETHRADQGDVFIGDLPLVVIVDGGTASASEIVSGSIQTEADNATIIGEQTVGTGTVLRRFELGDGSSIWLGIELWLTPEGEMIRDDGIAPDIVVPLAENQIRYEPVEPIDTRPEQIQDDQLNFAIALLLEERAYFPELDAAAAGTFAW